MPSPWKAILFDFDGTLVDSSESIFRTFTSVLDKHGFPAWGREKVVRHIGIPLRSLFYKVDPNLDAQGLGAMIKSFETFSGQQDVSTVRLQPGTRRTLDSLSGRSKLGIVTSRRSTGARRVLDFFGLEAHFSTIIGIENVEKPKPDAEPIRLALQRLSVDPQEALMVGDTPDDVESARRAGVFSVGVTTGVFTADRLAGADRVVSDLSDLADLWASPGPVKGARRDD